MGLDLKQYLGVPFDTDVEAPVTILRHGLGDPYVARDAPAGSVLARATFGVGPPRARRAWHRLRPRSGRFTPVARAGLGPQPLTARMQLQDLVRVGAVDHALFVGRDGFITGAARFSGAFPLVAVEARLRGRFRVDRQGPVLRVSPGSSGGSWPHPWSGLLSRAQMDRRGARRLNDAVGRRCRLTGVDGGRTGLAWTMGRACGSSQGRAGAATTRLKMNGRPAMTINLRRETHQGAATTAEVPLARSW